nr:ribonuclease H-like domain-containing protein [Tanacetum cinerariifolium]
MAFTSLSSSSFDSKVVSCSKACTKSYATLQSHYDKLTDDFRKSQFDVISYKTGLESVKAKLLVYQQNEYVFEEDIKLLKLKVHLRDNALAVLRQKFEKTEQERDDLKLKLEKFQTTSKNLSQLLASQTNDKIGLGYNTQVFTRSMFDCDEFFTYESDESFPASPIYDRGEITQNAPSFVQPTKQVKPLRSSVKTIKTSIPVDIHKTAIPKPKSNGNHRNRKACFVCKSLDHLIKDCDFYEKKMAQTPVRKHAQRGNHQQHASMTLPNPQKHVVPTAVLKKSKFVPITAARPVTATDPKSLVTRLRQAKTIVTKPYSPPKRNTNRSPSPKASNFLPKVTAAKTPMVNAIKGNWGNPQHALKDKEVIDSGCSRHMTGNVSYLSDFEELNGGYVAFGGNPKGGKISGKGKIRTGNLDFDDVYFVKELKFNLFSVSQMCNKKNNVLFTDTECLVLSPEFKLSDENQVLLRVPKENNVYNVDLKKIVPSRDLTCLFAKATLDESNLWHRRVAKVLKYDVLIVGYEHVVMNLWFNWNQ